MKNVQSIQFHTGSREELLPDFASDFPYISTCAELHKYPNQFVPWHWHKSVEIFYMEEGELDYYTPQKHLTFPKGSGGFVNSNILHMTKLPQKYAKTLQLLLLISSCSLLTNQK